MEILIFPEKLWLGTQIVLLMTKKKSPFYISKRVEVSQLAGIFLGEWGQRFFFIVMFIYLYGDLAIYAVAIPQSLLQATSGWKNNSTDQKVWRNFTEIEVYYLFLAVFAVVLVPLTFFDFQKTRYLQICTLVIRNISLFGMIILATIYDGEGEGHVPNGAWFNWIGFPDIFGTAIYAFMCHHSLPSIVTPIENQKKVKFMMLLDNLFVLVTYLLLCWTAIWAFGDVTNQKCDTNPGPPCMLQKLYTMNFASYKIKPIAIFLVLFPVFTLSTNFPLIAITLRNNLMLLIPYKKDVLHPTARRIIFALIATIPPLCIAFSTQKVDALVSITGAYAGLGIMFFFSCFTCILCSQACDRSSGPPR